MVTIRDVKQYCDSIKWSYDKKPIGGNTKPYDSLTVDIKARTLTFTMYSIPSYETSYRKGIIKLDCSEKKFETVIARINNESINQLLCSRDTESIVCSEIPKTPDNKTPDNNAHEDDDPRTYSIIQLLSQNNTLNANTGANIKAVNKALSKLDISSVTLLQGENVTPWSKSISQLKDS